MVFEDIVRGPRRVIRSRLPWNLGDFSLSVSVLLWPNVLVLYILSVRMPTT